MPSRLVSEILEIQEPTAELAATRSRSREEAISAIRLLEQTLVEALGGERLRGLPNLSVFDKFFAARVRGRINAVLIEREALVIDESGMLMIASTTATRAAQDEELFAEDLEHVMRTMKDVLFAHLLNTMTATSRYRRCEELAHTVRESLTKK